MVSKIIMKKILMTLMSCLCILGMCVGCSSGNDTAGDTNTSMNDTKDDSDVTDTMDELKDDMKDTADDIKDGMTDDNTTNSGAANSQTAN